MLRVTCTQIRNATQHDADFLGWVILAASRGHLARGWFDIALNLSEDGCLAFARQLSTSEIHSRWHYSRFLIAESPAGPAAALCAFRGADAYLISPAAVAQTAERVGLSRGERTAIWERGAYMFTCTTRPRDDTWVIESIATRPCHRQRGYTSALLDRALGAAATLGLREAEITVAIGNDAAAHAYEKAGFRWAGERRHPHFEAATGAPGQRRFIKLLRA